MYGANDDCNKCAYSRWRQEGGGDYNDMQLNCIKCKVCVTYDRSDEKACGLPDGKYYVVTYKIVGE